MLPICLSVLALIVPTCAIISPLSVAVEFLDFLDRGFDRLFDMPRLSAVGLAAAAATVFTPSRKMAWASTVASRGAVTCNVGSLGSDFAHHLCAHIFERVLQLDFLRHSHAVLGDDRRAELLFDDRVAPLGDPA